MQDAWRTLNQRAAGGVDRVTARDYEKELDANIKGWVERLKAKRYHARLIRRHYIPKSDGRQRPLGIPVVEDKLLQAAAAELLVAIYEQDFLPGSFGYRRGVGAKEAVRALTFNLQYGCFGYIVAADVRGFFDSLDHDWLLRRLRLRIGDEAFIGLIGQWQKRGGAGARRRADSPSHGQPTGRRGLTGLGEWVLALGAGPLV